MKYTVEEIIEVLKWMAGKEDSLNYMLKNDFQRHFEGYAKANFDNSDEKEAMIESINKEMKQAFLGQGLTFTGPQAMVVVTAILVKHMESQ